MTTSNDDLSVSRRATLAALGGGLGLAMLTGSNAVGRQNATPSADEPLADDATPPSIQQQIDDLRTLEEIEWPVAVATSFSVQRESAQISNFDELANKSCSRSGMVVVSGSAATNQNGTVSFALRDYACLVNDESYRFAERAVVQVTPNTQSPVFVTVAEEITADNRDVMISVYSWGVDGQPMANVWFNWTCIVPGDIPVQ